MTDFTLRRVATSEAPRTPFKAPTNAANWLLSFGIVAVCVGLSYLTGEARGWAAGLSFGALALLVQIAWPLRRETWFLLTLAALIGVHAAGFVYLDWSWVEKRDGLKLLGQLVVVDLFVMMAIIYGLYRLKYGTPVEAIEPSIDDLPRYTANNIDL